MHGCIAAVLDYVVEEPVEGKIASLQGRLDLALVEGTKHIMELAPHCEGSVRIGFKLESGVKLRDLIHRPSPNSERAQMTASSPIDWRTSMTPNDPERTWSIVRVRHGCSRAKPMSIERFEPHRAWPLMRQFAVLGHRTDAHSTWSLNDLPGRDGLMC